MSGDAFIPPAYIVGCLEDLCRAPWWLHARFKPLTPEERAAATAREEDYNRRRALALEIFPELADIEQAADDW